MHCLCSSVHNIFRIEVDVCMCVGYLLVATRRNPRNCLTRAAAINLIPPASIKATLHEHYDRSSLATPSKPSQQLQTQGVTIDLASERVIIALNYDAWRAKALDPDLHTPKISRIYLWLRLRFFETQPFCNSEYVKVGDKVESCWELLELLRFWRNLHWTLPTCWGASGTSGNWVEVGSWQCAHTSFPTLRVHFAHGFVLFCLVSSIRVNTRRLIILCL